MARGSGFIIYSSPNKVLIMTNSHVVDEAKSVFIRTEQTQKTDLKASVIGICPSKDLALIELNKDEIIPELINQVVSPVEWLKTMKTINNSNQSILRNFFNMLSGM